MVVSWPHNRCTALSVPETVLRYSRHSSLTDGRMDLASSEEQADGSFFAGRLREPRVASMALRCLSRVVGERYWSADEERDRRLGMLDPVVTSDRGRLRFEGFSGCRSAYARVDLLPAGLEVVDQRFGTTNVDFNPPLRDALARVMPDDALSLNVDSGSLALAHGDEVFVEKKVELPVSWLRGLASIPLVEAEAEPVASVEGAGIARWFRQIPRTGNDRQSHWVDPRQHGRITSRPVEGGLEIASVKRLLILHELISHASRLSIARDVHSGGTVWRLDGPGLRFTLALSSRSWRGFSGEGRSLTDLAGTADADLEVAIEGGDETLIDPDSLGRLHDLPLPAVRASLASLASQGKLGFDAAEGRWYRRRIPAAEALSAGEPNRLRQARKWLETGAIDDFSRDGSACRARVTGVNGAAFLVTFDRSGDGRCTCPWFTRFGLSRGPCSHLLALDLLRKSRP